LFMTFFGEYRGEAENAHGSHSAHDAHGGIHESPKVMVVPLVILAVLSVIGGYVGVPGSLGGSDRFDKFLGPVFHGSAPANAEQKAVGEKGAPEQETEGPEPKTGASTELMFTGISVLAAFLGLGFAWLLYHKDPQLPDRIAASFSGAYRTLVHKYYVDEFYAILFVKPLIDGSTRILWHGVDQNIIDAAVNDAGEGAEHVSDEVRHMQSGNIRSYAGWIAAGAAAVLAFMIWMGVSAR
jgi:NADH-quinone oxidoreductase subunit L